MHGWIDMNECMEGKIDMNGLMDGWMMNQWMDNW